MEDSDDPEGNDLAFLSSLSRKEKKRLLKYVKCYLLLTLFTLSHNIISVYMSLLPNGFHENFSKENYEKKSPLRLVKERPNETKAQTVIPQNTFKRKKNKTKQKRKVTKLRKKKKRKEANNSN